MDLSLVPRTGQPVFRTSGRGNRGGRAACRRAGEDPVPVVSAVPGGRPRLPLGSTWDLGGFLGSGTVPPDPAARGRPDRRCRWTPAVAGVSNVGLLAGAKPASRRARAAASNRPASMVRRLAPRSRRGPAGGPCGQSPDISWREKHRVEKGREAVLDGREGRKRENGESRRQGIAASVPWARRRDGSGPL